jgi:prevent-host-death family protein
MRVLPLAEVKAKLSELVATIETTDEEITITKNGRAAAVLVSHQEFERWKETADIFADKELLTEVREGMASLKRGKGRLFRSRDLDRLFATPRRRA